MTKGKQKIKVSGTKPTKAVSQSYKINGQYHTRKSGKKLKRELSPEAKDVYKRIEKIDFLIGSGVTSKKLIELENARKVLIARFMKFNEGGPPKKPRPTSPNSVRTVDNKTSYKQSAKVSNFESGSDLINAKHQHYPVAEEASEGQTKLRTHLSHERNTRIVKLKKKKTLEETGCLKCEVCNFDFFEVYGERGTGFIECHHLTPLSDVNRSQKTNLSDLSLVCSNCHRMIHNKSPLLTIFELKKLISKSF